MPTLLSREALQDAFTTVVCEIEADREEPGRYTTGFYALNGEGLFDACYLALQDGCAATESQADAQHRLHVVSAPAGAGKTTFSVAFLAALVRLGERTSGAGFECLFLVDQMTKADDLFRRLSALLPGKVAVWTSDHDKACVTPDKVKDPLRARFERDDLARHPVAITTHAFYQGARGHKARMVLRDGTLHPRVLTVVDERPDQVTIHETTAAAAVAVQEALQDDPETQVVAEHMAALTTFMFGRMQDGTTDLEKPGDAPVRAEWRRAADALWWFTSKEAAAFARSHTFKAGVTPVFGFAKALATGYAFITRDRGGQGVPRFIGYEPHLMLAPGMVMLDATADIDGVTTLCPWRAPRPMPQALYDNLSIIHVQPPTRERVAKQLMTLDGRNAYVAWMMGVIIANSQPWDRVLIVAKKSLLDNKSVPLWHSKDSRWSTPEIYTEEFGWSFDLRQISITHWGGGGIGANHWKEADVVILFDEFWLPRRTFIATSQGLQGLPATEGDLGRMTTVNSNAAAVNIIEEGHRLRWAKQMALRGRARQFDENGLCGSQKLVVTGDLRLLLTFLPKLFPGAPGVEAQGCAVRPYTQAEALLAILSRPGLPDELEAKWVAAALGVKWRDVSPNVTRGAVARAVAELGWTYEGRRGRGGGSRFVRSSRKVAEAA